MVEKVVVGYAEPLSTRPGRAVRVHAASHDPGRAVVDVVRLTGAGRGDEVVVGAIPPAAVTLDAPDYPQGSSASADVDVDGAVRLGVDVWPTSGDGALVSVGNLVLCLADRYVEVRSAGTVLGRSALPLTLRRWHRVVVDGELTVTRMVDPHRPEAAQSASTPLAGVPLAVADRARFAGDGFDGKLARPWIDVEGRRWRWRLPDVELHQLPATAVTGPAWDGTTHSASDAPEQYDAVHFHSDDLYDAGWAPTVEWLLPDDLPSGVYAARIRADRGQEDRVPFFVAAPPGRAADVVFLAPVATYLAYANHRLAVDGSEIFKTSPDLTAEQRYLRAHPEVGLSQYEYHRDRSGVAFSSWRRPILNMRPGADTWGFTPDLAILAFLTATGLDVGVVTDEQLHTEGAAALGGCRTLVTGSHPEYWSTAMLDGLVAWLGGGGRLAYLGGNGFYWRVAFSDDWPGAMEVRRTEDGTRAWIAEPGEGHHAFGGEYGGLWRRLGRAPNMVAGVGFAAQGFERSSPYVRTHAGHDERVAWIFRGVASDRFGDHGIGGGAAGQEIDRHDVALGSPAHALVIATATDFGPDMLRTKEDFHTTVVPRVPDRYARSDMVFFETPSGGAVFSVGSIAWWAALGHDAGDNDVARITANVVRRFADPAPFVWDFSG